MIRKVIISLFFASLLTFVTVLPVKAEGLSIGVSSWYCWWKFNDNSNMSPDPTLLIGPAMSARFSESWSLAGVFLYGRFKQEEDNDSNTKINRMDSDISLNYNINRYFKIFGGAKLMGFWWDQPNGSGTHSSAGPGLGIGTTIPLSDYFYFLFNVSGTSSWGKHETPSGGSESESEKSNLNENGINSNASIAYYIASASTSITVGFRYQYLFINYMDDKMKDEGMSFYGATLSAVFSF